MTVSIFSPSTLRRTLFRRAAERGIWAVTAGPIGCSAAWLVFDPNGMSFDEYFDINDSMSLFSQLVAFSVGLTPWQRIGLTST